MLIQRLQDLKEQVDRALEAIDGERVGSPLSARAAMQLRLIDASAHQIKMLKNDIDLDI